VHIGGNRDDPETKVDELKAKNLMTYTMSEKEKELSILKRMWTNKPINNNSGKIKTNKRLNTASNIKTPVLKIKFFSLSIETS